MDGDFMVDLEEVLRNIETAQVLSVLFPLFQKTLLVDARHDQGQGPLIKLVPMAGSVEERLRSLRRMRPHFPQPHSLTVIPWPKRVLSLKTLGIWDRIVERLLESGHRGMEKAARDTFQELLRREWEELTRALSGEGYHTLWSAKDQY